MKTVRICGSAPNLMEMPDLPEGDEMWMANSPKTIRKFVGPHIFPKWTRWFNLHSRYHMEITYPLGFNWYRGLEGDKPFYTQQMWNDIPGCTVFPYQQILDTFPEAGRYYTCSINWMAAFAIMEGFERIEFWGLFLRDKKREGQTDYAFERRCFFYWLNQATSRGIEVIYPPEVHLFDGLEPGDPLEYDGPLYGYETKPEERRVKCDCPVEYWWATARKGAHLQTCPSHMKSLDEQLEYQLRLPIPKGQ